MTGTELAEFEAVLESELDLIARTRNQGPGGAGSISNGDKKSSVYTRACQSHLTGLAFSGGGIRSATFNLGVIQALAKLGLLSKFDYLSTVSGGGYIGGWLSSLLHNQANGREVDEKFVEDISRYLKPHPRMTAAHTFRPAVGFPPVEHKAVRYLRRYSNYLSPRLGLSGDILAVISIFLRNFILIQLALISLTAGILLSAHTAGVTSRYAGVDLTDVLGGHLGYYLGRSWSFAGAMLVLGVAVWFTGRLMENREVDHDKPLATDRAVHLGVILPSMLSAWCFAAAVANHPGITTHGDPLLSRVWVWVTGVGIVYSLAWGLGLMAARSVAKEPSEEAARTDALENRFKLAAIALIMGGLLGLILYGVVHKIDTLDPGKAVNLWSLITYGPPIFILILSFVVVVHIGTAGRGFDEHDREWLGRLGGFLLLYSLVWVLVFSMVLYATPFVHWLAGGGFAVIVAWIIGSGSGAWLARGSSTGGEQGESLWKEACAKLAPWVFIAGLLVIITFTTQKLLFKYFIGDAQAVEKSADFFIDAALTLNHLSQMPMISTALVTLATLLFFMLVIYLLDINLFSMHALYSNRLSRAYLGATRAGKRHPSPFTGFDKKDDVNFSDLSNQRPIPIINTAINMTGGDDLAWQTRRAASFAITPHWAGFETASSQGYKLGGYRPTREYAEGRPLGVWIAVSGAAASPNMGYHTSPSVAALLTAFNLRLGRWCGNPMRDTWNKISPIFAATPIFAELTGSATAQADWINLTDGGHFENLGVYELLRRRCRLIVAVDAGCDPNYEYADLANLIRLAWTDLGVNLRFEAFEDMYLKKSSRFLKRHYMLGRIQYSSKGPEGVILYIKSSLTGDEWPDIRQYADMKKDFPHETTADQFFNENQFEAYRHLGYKSLAKTLYDLEEKNGVKLKDLPMDKLVEDLASKIIKKKTGRIDAKKDRDQTGNQQAPQ